MSQNFRFEENDLYILTVTLIINYVFQLKWKLLTKRFLFLNFKHQNLEPENLAAVEGS